MPDIAAAYKECDAMNDNVASLMKIYEKRFADVFASIEAFAAILSVVQSKDGEIMPFTTEYGNGKNAAEIVKIVEKYYPHIDPMI